MGDIEARELKLYIDNDYELYSGGQRTSIIDNLLRKKNAGKYDHDLAAKLWEYYAESGAKKYAKDFGGTWHQIFDVPTRKAVARELRDDFESLYSEGEYTERQRQLETKAQRKAREGGGRKTSKRPAAGDGWWGPGQRWVEQEAAKEYAAQLQAHIKRGRSKNTFRYVVPDWQRELVDALGANDEETFKFLKLQRIGMPHPAKKTPKKRSKRTKRPSTCGTSGGRCTKAEIERMFKETVMPSILESESYDGIPDKPMRREAWNNWIDGLAQDGTITERQAETWGHPRWLETWKGRR